MGEWWKKKAPLSGSVLFRGELRRPLNDFADMAKRGITITPLPDSPKAHWSATLSHPEWGDATLVCLRDAPKPPIELLQFMQLSDEERAAAMLAETAVQVTMEPKHGNILRDRKLLLRYLQASMGDDGLLALDHLSELGWTRAALADELCHNADLDVEAIFCIHAVQAEGCEAAYWMHTHGLHAVGGFDFDVIEPGEEAQHNCGDLFRAMAFAIVEGKVTQTTPAYQLIAPNGIVRLVPITRFLSETTPRLRALIGDGLDKDHQRNRVVLCQPEGNWFSRLFQRGLQPARILQHVPENPLIMFSDEASALMATRARDTYTVLQRVHEEFADFCFPTLVKLGYKTDHDDGREHLWFKVHAFQGDSIDATLLNQPYDVASLKEGQRGQHAAELISDWSMMTPGGVISPRSLLAARRLRENMEQLLEHKDEIRAAMQQC